MKVKIKILKWGREKYYF